jgi:hypothetical protein
MISITHHHRSNDFHLYRQLVCIYREHQPANILHFTIKPNIFGTFAAAQADIPSIVTITGPGNDLAQWFAVADHYKNVIQN